MCDSWVDTRSNRGRSADCLLKDGSWPGEIVPTHYIAYPLGKYVWAWPVNEDNWACRLGHYTVGFSHPGPVGWRVWAKAHGTHNAPLFPVREGSLRRLGKENVYDWFSVGNSGLLMLVCSNMRITGKFSNFLVSHLMWLFGILLKLEVLIKGLQGGGFLCATGYYWFFSGKVSRCRESDFMIAAWERLTKGV